jgi:ABC-type transport system involved in multi-copper enzyme maturation permease subunit
MSRKILFIIVGVGVLLIAIIAVSVFTILPAVTQASSTATPTTTPAPSVSPTPKRAATNIYAPYLKLYGFNIKSQIAQGLHLSADQLTQQLNAGKTLSDIASAQGVSTTQLQSIVGNAIQSAFQPVVNSGALTQQQVARLVKRLQKNPNALDSILLHAKAP